jgi:hypothetical protein
MASANVANTLVVPVESKVAPFYDDFDESKNFHRILFRPGYAVQARELTQVQTILQNQIERFGKHIFVNGSSVIGGKIDLTEAVTINLATQFANTDITIEDFRNKTIKYGNGNNSVIAKVIQVSAGNDTEPPALHVKYISGEEFGPGSTIRTTVGNISANLVSSANVSAPSLVSFIYDSIYFYNGYFIKVPTQAVVVGKYDRIPTIRVGLEMQDDIVTESDDATLLDPALEASNYQAPGAARYKTELIYSTRSINSVDDEKFIQIAKITDGRITEQTRSPLYSEIEEVLARRTYDESGNYTVKPFILNIEDSPTDPANNFLLSISSGKAYLYGYECERQVETKIELPRARETNSKTNFDINLNYGNYVIVEDLKGAFNTSGLGIVDMHCVAQSAISYANTTTYNSTKVGNVRVRDLEFYSGDIDVADRKFEFYFFEPNFQNLNGRASSLANSTSEIVLQANNTSSVDDAYTGAYIKIDQGIASGDLRQIASYNGATKIASVYVPFTSNTSSNSVYTISYDITDVDSFGQIVNFTSGATSNATATISAISKDSGQLSGNTIVSEPNRQAGYFSYPNKFIAPGITNEAYIYRRVFNRVQFIDGTSVVLTASTDEDFEGATGSNTASTVLDNFLVIVTDNQGAGRATGEQVKVAATVTTSTPEQAVLSTGNTSESFLATVYSKMSAFGTSAQPRVKTLVKANTRVFTSDTAANTFVGPTGSTAIVYPNAGQVVILNPSKETSVIESLYLSDVIEVVKIFSYSGNSAPAANTSLANFTDVTSRYQADGGQRLTHYDHAAIRLKPGFAAPSGNLVVCCRAFKTTNDTGYFSVDSYPSLNSIVLEEGVNIGTGYTLIPKLGSVRLSDVIDFRPVRPNATNTENFGFNTSRVPVPATDFRSDYSHYMRRRDLISLNLNREIELITGKSQVNPNFPSEPNRNLTLHKLSLNPYTETKKDVIVETVDHRRYTMKDIASIDRRLKNVEYSVSLSALEQKATDILIQDVDGLDRTKFGILADSFNSHLLGDTNSPDYACAVDTTGKLSGTEGTLLPKLAGNYFKLKANTQTATGISIHDDKVMLGYATSAAIFQTVATKTTPVAEYLYAGFRGDIVTIPEADMWKDTTVLPDTVISIPVITPRPSEPRPRPPVVRRPPVTRGGSITTPAVANVTVIIDGSPVEKEKVIETHEVIITPPPGGLKGYPRPIDNTDDEALPVIIEKNENFEMLLILTDSINYEGLGSLVFDPVTGSYRHDTGKAVVVNGVTQTTGLTYEQAANYAESMIQQQTGSIVNITAENIKFIDAAYRDILNRPPEGSGMTYWAQIYATGNYTESEMYQLIVDGAISSSEILGIELTAASGSISLTPSARVRRDSFTYSTASASVTEDFQVLETPNYTDILGDDNLTRVNSPKELFTDLYQASLGREPDDAGLDYWINEYNTLGARAAIDNFRFAVEVNIASGIEPGRSDYDVFTGE